MPPTSYHCFHCSLRFNYAPFQYEGKNFCCRGCKTVFQLIKNKELDTFYELIPGAGNIPQENQDRFDILKNLEFARSFISFEKEGLQHAQIKLKKQAWNTEKILKKLAKWSIYFIISFVISNVFLAYLIGSDELLQYIITPKEHLKTLLILLCFTAVFYWVFAWFREQVCIIACPYGRLQGVLLDRHSIVVAYDHKRGEKEVGRAKFNKREDRAASGKGDCIDCNQCVHVCPTGIDIRNGTQLECVNCTACMDVCDEIMTSVKLPKKLIRYASEDQIELGKPFRFSARLKGYTAVLLVLIAVFVGLILTRTTIEATLLRLPGQLYTVNEESNTIRNVYTYKIINKSSLDYNQIEMRLLNQQGTLFTADHQGIQLKAEAIQDGTFFIELPRSEWVGKKLKIKVGFFSNNQLIEQTTTQFLGPRSYR